MGSSHLIRVILVNNSEFVCMCTIPKWPSDFLRRCCVYRERIAFEIFLAFTPRVDTFPINLTRGGYFKPFTTDISTYDAHVFSDIPVVWLIGGCMLSVD